MTKKSIIVKIESENGVQEFEITTRNWGDMMYAIFAEGFGRVSPKTMKSILNTCEDDELIRSALAYHRGYVSGKDASAVMHRLPQSKEVQHGLIAYGIENHNNTVIKRIAENTLDPKIREEACSILRDNNG